MKRLLLMSLLIQALALSACGDDVTGEPIQDAGDQDKDKDKDEDKDPDKEPPAGECDGEAPLSQTLAPKGDGQTTNTALCPIEGGARHIMVDGLVVPSGFISTALHIGIDEPIGTQDDLPTGALRIMAYAGSTFLVKFGDTSISFNNPTFTTDGTPFCLDIFDGSETSSPSVYVWVNGHAGADCADRSTLSMYNTFGAIHQFGDETGAIAFDKDIYYYANAAITVAPTVTLDNENAIDDTLVASCVGDSSIQTLTLEEDVELKQALCPNTGSTGHVRIGGVTTPLHGAVYLYLGGSELPGTHSGEVPEGMARITAYGGHGTGAMLTFSFGAGSFQVPTPTFLSDGIPFCLDIHNGNDSFTPAFALWVSGHDDADCSDRETLTLANVYAFINDFGENGTPGAIAPAHQSYVRATAPVAGVTAAIALGFDASPVLTAEDVRP